MNTGKIIFITILVALGVAIAWWFMRPPSSALVGSVSQLPQPQIINQNNNQVMNQDSSDTPKKQATITTSRGVITLEFYPSDAPKTVENFITLAEKGFYNGVRFHRVIKGFMIQGGDPLSKDDANVSRWGTGGPGYQFADELNPNTTSYKAGYKKGVVAMANAGPNTNGSQFFIMLEDYPLPNNYTIFGRVVSGQDVVDAIGVTPTDQNDRPKTPVTIEKVEVQ
jgi:cyclophilin family peptidyl-prolyl cis-trans isomerase